MANYLDQNGLLYFKTKLDVLLADKVDKESGKSLSSNDYTSEDKAKLAGIETGAKNTAIINGLTSTSTTAALAANQGKILNDKIIALSDSVTDSNYGDMHKATYDSNGDGIVDNAAKLGGNDPSYYAKASDLPEIVTTSASGLMTAADKVKLDGIATGATKTVVDTALSGTSTNPVQNKVINTALSGKSDTTHTHPIVTTSANGLMTAADKTKLDGIAANAQVNVIESIKVNGSALTISSKSVNIPVPTTVASLSDSANYALKTDLTNVYKYQGSVATFADLPVTSTAGFVYNVEVDGMNWAWNGTEWDNLGTIFTISTITNSQIDTIFAS